MVEKRKYLGGQNWGNETLDKAKGWIKMKNFSNQIVLAMKISYHKYSYPSQGVEYAKF